MPYVSSSPGGRGDRRLQITEFHGIDQSRGLFSGDYMSSPDAENFIVRNGIMRTAGGVLQFGAVIAHFNEPETSAAKPRLFQAFFRAADGTDYSRLVASFDRQIYVYSETENEWVPSGFVTKDGVDMVSYRHETDEWAIFSDGDGNLSYWDGSISGLMPIAATQGGVAVKFQQLSLIHERLWGAVLQDSPDRIYWSASFSPDDWEINASMPDDGGGFLDIATFDGGRIRAVMAAFDGIVVFKDRSVHKISGTYPGEFAVSQVYGTEGTLASRSIVNAGSAVYFLSSDGLCRYDGVSVVSLRANGDRKLKDVWASLNHGAIDNVCAAYCNGVIYMAVPLSASESRNTHVIEYDVAEGVYSIVELPGVDDFIVRHEGQRKTLFAIIWDKVYKYDTGASFPAGPINAVWTSPEISCGSLTSKKQTGYLYITVEGTSLSVDRSPSVKLSMISGDKIREKTITLKTGSNTIRTRIKIRGRSFRFRIENTNGDPLTIHRGMEIAVEETFD